MSRAPSSALHWITAIILGAVMVSLAWMVLAVHQPQEVEILLILGLLLTALILVSAVALHHTRSRKSKEE